MDIAVTRTTDRGGWAWRHGRPSGRKHAWSKASARAAACRVTISPIRATAASAVPRGVRARARPQAPGRGDVAGRADRRSEPHQSLVRGEPDRRLKPAAIEVSHA